MSRVMSAQRPGNGRTVATAMPPNVRQDNSQDNLPCAGLGPAMSAPETCETARKLGPQQPHNGQGTSRKFSGADIAGPSPAQGQVVLRVVLTDVRRHCCCHCPAIAGTLRGHDANISPAILPDVSRPSREPSRGTPRSFRRAIGES